MAGILATFWTRFLTFICILLCERSQLFSLRRIHDTFSVYFSHSAAKFWALETSTSFCVKFCNCSLLPSVPGYLANCFQVKISPNGQFFLATFVLQALGIRHPYNASISKVWYFCGLKQYIFALVCVGHVSQNDLNDLGCVFQLPGRVSYIHNRSCNSYSNVALETFNFLGMKLLYAVLINTCINLAWSSISLGLGSKCSSRGLT